MPSDGALVPLDTAAASDADVSIATDGCVEIIGLTRAQLWSKVITATSNLGVGYNYFSASWAMLWLSNLYGDPEWADDLARNAIFVGNLLGMTVMGALGDVLGRNRAMVLTLSLMAAGALLSGVAPWGPPDAVWAILVACRLLIGIGAGGVYPLSATKAAEDAVTTDPATRSQAAAWGFFWGAPGIILVYGVGLLLSLTVGGGASFAAGEGAGCNASSASAPSLPSPAPPPPSVTAGWEAAWRLQLSLGALPIALILFQATRQRDSAATVAAREAARSDGTSTLALLRRGGYGRQLLATGGGWICFDIGFYGNALLQPRILADMFTGDTVPTEASKNILVASMAVIFNFIAIPLIPRVGTRNLQVFGFVFSAVVALTLALAWRALEDGQADGTCEYCGGIQFALYALLYGSYAFVSITTFVLPSETFEPEVRTTLNGLSAAMGKLGAIGGSYVFGAIITCAPDPNGAISLILGLVTAAELMGAVLTVIGVGVSRPPFMARVDER